MKGQNLVKINGRFYDAVSGLPAASHEATEPSLSNSSNAGSPKPTPSPNPHRPMRAFSDIGPVRQTHTQPSVTPPLKHVSRHAQQTPHLAVHKKLQKSQTLARRPLKQPPAPLHHEAKSSHQEKPTIHFAPHPKPIATHEPSPLLSHSRPVLEPPKHKPAAAHQTHSSEIAKVQAQPEPAHTPQIAARDNSQVLKEALIKEGLAQAEANRAQKPKKVGIFKRLRSKQSKFTTIMSTSLSVLILGAYLTYINLPNISMRVAATRAGINATLPGYHPDGYGLSGAITYAPSEVSVNYKSNTSEQGFTVTQRASSWDSQSVLSKYVNKQTTAYLTLQENGLTVYTFGNKAAWSNGGLFYTIEGDAPLSSEQIVKIASSM